jgi:CcmD family protein
MDPVKLGFAVVNVGIWTGLFIYLLRLHQKIRHLEKQR